MLSIYYAPDTKHSDVLHWVVTIICDVGPVINPILQMKSEAQEG